MKMPIKPSIVGAIFALGFVTCIHGKSTPSSTKDGNKKEAGPPPGVLPMTSRFCAWSEKFGSGGGNWNEDFHENVSYRKLFKTNTNDLGSSLDKETGVFTTPYDGYWEISYTYEAMDLQTSEHKRQLPRHHAPSIRWKHRVFESSHVEWLHVQCDVLCCLCGLSLSISAWREIKDDVTR